jgi:hypothetical protein
MQADSFLSPTMLRAFVLLLACGVGIGGNASAEYSHTIVIDGAFGDWAGIPSYTDPADDQHDTDHTLATDVPAYVNHPDVDLLEYKVAHDDKNLYAYFRARGIIGNTQPDTQGAAGRYYGIVTIDVDNNDATGYWLNEGGYYPTSPGYDMNMEIEWYNGTFNTGHYINHGATNQQELDQAFLDQSNGFVRILPGSYDYYTQWVMFDDGSIVYVLDKGPVYQGIVTVRISPDGHEMEMAAPYRGFMVDPQGNPIVALGKTLDLSFSLEASGELAPGAQWASDTAAPIVGYVLDGPDPTDSDGDGLTDVDELAMGLNPNSKDTDGDTLQDGWEVNYTLDANDATGPNGADGDPDNDGFTNAQEQMAGTDPKDPNSAPQSLPAATPWGLVLLASLQLAAAVVAFKRLPARNSRLG